ncbi:glutamate receptor ionotropic, kainate glr-3-like [Palaemon carinicauda]|uniref:glutamate receptor ionotropic, kainate glr-3-like n=1 Tax=Palaemon carinicauda TaxID=392227 RepID=UPI0035B5A1F9
MANLLNALAKSLKFKYVLVRPPDGAWGIPTSSGDWNGMIGMVKRNEADIALGPFGLTYSRSRVVDFSSPILIDYYRILVKRPRSEPDPWGFLRPFSWGVWIGLVLSLCAATLLVYVTKYNWMADSQHRGTTGNIQALMKLFYELYSSLMTQPLTWIPTRDSLRVAVCFWLFVVLVFSRVFSSSLTSLLAVRNVPIKYDYLRQVIDDPKMNLIFEKATALVEHMSKVESGIYRELADVGKVGRSHFLASSKLYDAAYADVRHKQYALLVEDVTCRKVFSDDFTKYGRCDFYIGKEKYWPLIFCLIGKKGYPLMKAINEKIGRMTSHDLYFKWLGYELPNATACLKATTRVTVNEAYDLTGLWGVFTLFSGGIVLSFTALLLEIIFVGVQK